MTWQRAHCVACWRANEHCPNCPCHDNDEGSDCD